MIEIIGEYLNLIAQGCPFTTINADGSQRKAHFSYTDGLHIFKILVKRQAFKYTHLV